MRPTATQPSSAISFDQRIPEVGAQPEAPPAACRRPSPTDELSTSPAPVDDGSRAPRTAAPRSADEAGGGSSTTNLVVVSNRLPDRTKPAAGGLAVALAEMSSEEKILWFGWSNETTKDSAQRCVNLQKVGRTTFAQIDLSKWEKDNYYAGFANSVLWPVFHEKPDYAELKPEYFEAYKQVNKMFASHLAPMLKKDDVLWIHDYHLIPLAEELRALGCQHRMGFFNHIPFPEPAVVKEIPQHRELIRALFSYDLVGMQQPRDVANLLRYVETEGVCQGIEGTRVNAFGRSASFNDFPIGIAPGKFKTLAPALPRSQEILAEVRREGAVRRLMIGVDRLDYTKGVPERLEAFGEYLRDNPQMRGQVTFVQVASPTRGKVPAYEALSSNTRKLVDELNEEFAQPGWKPVIYYNEEVEREALPELYRMSRVGVVTPSLDGMNLVAKEYVAAQSPEDPGVLVLSKRAGAASQLSNSVLVPPQDRPAISRAYGRALTMPLDERKSMHAANYRNVTTETVHGWFENFLGELDSVTAPSHEQAG